jgi:hypothetical protein
MVRLIVGFLTGAVAATLWFVFIDGDPADGLLDGLPQLTGQELPQLTGQEALPPQQADPARRFGPVPPWLLPEPTLPAVSDGLPGLEELHQLQTETGQLYFAAVDAYRTLWPSPNGPTHRLRTCPSC